MASERMQSEKDHVQHRTVNVFEHSVGVACFCLLIADKLRIKVDEQALVRGALLHDYFLYDWHDPDPKHRWHGFRHARFALNNAIQDFSLGNIERDMIKKHMFPLNLTPPKYRESLIICLADKICATCEILAIPYYQEKMGEVILEL